MTLSKIIGWSAIVLVVAGAVVLFSPWTYPVYLWLFPAELTNPAYEGNKGGPFPELLGIPMLMLGFFLAALSVVVEVLGGVLDGGKK